MAILARNTIANFVGRAWGMLIGMVFTPIYLHLLGVEAYGLIGFFLTLQSVLGMLDLGLSLTLNRELARASSGTMDVPQMARMLRTMEIAYWTLSVAIGGVVVVLAPWIARQWINAVALPDDQVEQAVQLMGVVIALQAPFALYQGGLFGLQQQVRANVIVVAAATIRAVGAALVLWLIVSRVEAFFLWQAAVALLATALSARALWRLIPGGSAHSRFDFSLIQHVWRFAAAVSANTLLGTALTQLDKLILSKLLNLEQFAYYMLATLVASSLWAIILPINASLFPKFVQLHELQDTQGLAHLYHKACQFMSVALIPIALMLVLFPHELLLVWTNDAQVAQSASFIVALLSIGTLINGLVSVGAYLQSAAGWPTLILYTNAVLVCLLVPVLLVAVPRFGPAGAAGVWIAVNSTYLLFTIPIMHRRLLKGELGSWWLFDVTVPAVAACLVGVTLKLLMPAGWPMLGMVAYIGITWAIAVAAAGLVSPHVRRTVISMVTRILSGKSMVTGRGT